MQNARNSHSLPDVVTECHITECAVEPDGRLSVQCLGVRRLRTAGSSELDGYRICQVAHAVADDPLPSAPPQADETSGAGAALPEPIAVR